MVGPDCRFGYKGSGGLALLRELSESFGYRVTVLDKAMYRGEVISSSRIRDCLSQGQIEESERDAGIFLRNLRGDRSRASAGSDDGHFLRSIRIRRRIR